MDKRATIQITDKDGEITASVKECSFSDVELLGHLERLKEYIVNNRLPIIHVITKNDKGEPNEN